MITQLDKRLPIAQWQVVRVTFTAANADKDIPHTLSPPTPEHVEYVVLRQSGAGSVYQDFSATRLAWQPGFILLRCSATITVDLLLLVLHGDPRTVIS
jgi:hypothetical protein